MSYDEPSVIVPPGENVLTLGEDGSASVTRKLPDERPNIWKGAKAIEECADDKIVAYPPRPSGVIDYHVLDAPVIWRGLGNGPERQFVCLKSGHGCNDCPHTRRLQRWRTEHAA